MSVLYIFFAVDFKPHLNAFFNVVLATTKSYIWRSFSLKIELNWMKIEWKNWILYNSHFYLILKINKIVENSKHKKLRLVWSQIPIQIQLNICIYV